MKLQASIVLIVHRLLRTSVAVRGQWRGNVAHAPKEPNLQAAISDGSRLQSLSARWGGMSEEEKMVYSNIALAKQAQFSGQSDSGSEDFHDVPDVPQGMPSHGCPWSLGAGRDCPLSLPI